MRYNIQNINNTRLISDLFFNKRSRNNVINHSNSFNILEDDKQFSIELIAPGLQKEDFNIKIDKNQLNISVNNKETKSLASKKLIRQDFTIGALNKSFTMPNTVDLDKIEGTYNAEILTITLPLKKEIVRNMSREININ